MTKPKGPSSREKDLPETHSNSTKRFLRTFRAEYKLSVIQQAGECKHGELGALLEREKLYSNQLQQWRKEFEEQGIVGLSKSSPGPKAHKDVEQENIRLLEQELAHLKLELTLKDNYIDIQKKILMLIEQVDQAKCKL